MAVLIKRNGSTIDIENNANALIIKESIDDLSNLDECLGVLKNLESLTLMSPNCKYRKLDFLRACPQLKRLHIAAMMALEDFSGIRNCTQLQHLGIGSYTQFDFNCINELERLESLKSFSEFTKNAHLIGSRNSLVELEVHRIRLEDLKAYSKLFTLKKLRLWCCDIKSTTGIESLECLTDLDLGHSRFVEFSGLSELKNITRLGLDALKHLSGLDCISVLSLRHVGLENLSLRSLSRLSAASQLESISFYFSKVLDEDFSFLGSLSKIKIVSVDRKYQGIILKLFPEPRFDLSVRD